MSEEKRIPPYGFKIKWADREVEYYGDAAREVFNTVFEHVKTVPITSVQPVQPPEQTSEVALVPPITSEKQPTPPVEAQEYDRIIKDAKVTKEQLVTNIKFERRDEFTELIPYLPKHPDERDAVILVSYALQVGLQKTPIDVTYLRTILKGPNGYPLAGNQLGVILRDFRNTDVTIASQTQERYKPFTLSTKGLDRARSILRGK